MKPENIEKGLARIIIGTIGIIVTLCMLLGFIPGIAIGLGGLDHQDIWSIFFGVGFVFSFFGLFGAWWRLSQTYQLMSEQKIEMVRRLLGCGIFSTILLSVGTVGIFGVVGLFGVLIFSFMAVAGVVFLSATPKNF